MKNSDCKPGKITTRVFTEVSLTAWIDELITHFSTHAPEEIARYVSPDQIDMLRDHLAEIILAITATRP